MELLTEECVQGHCVKSTENVIVEELHVYCCLHAETQRFTESNITPEDVHRRLHCFSTRGDVIQDMSLKQVTQQVKKLYKLCNH